MLPIVSRCNELISRKNVFVTKNPCGNDFLSHVENMSVASSEALIQRCYLMKYGASIGNYSFRIAFLNIFGNSLQNISDRAHIQHNYELSICALSGMVFWGFHENFQKSFFKEHSWQDACDFSSNIFRIPFSRLTPGGNERSYIHKQTSN